MPHGNSHALPNTLKWARLRIDGSFRAAAASLPLVSPEHVRFLLDGRDVHELVALCDQLADASERAAAASGRSAG